MHIAFEMRVLFERSEVWEESIQSFVACSSRSPSCSQISQLPEIMYSNMNVEGAMKEWLSDVEDRFRGETNKKREFFSRLPSRGSFEERRREAIDT